MKIFRNALDSTFIDKNIHVILVHKNLNYLNLSQLRNQTFFIKGDLCPIEHWLVEFVRLGLYRELKPESPAINYWLDDLHADLDLHA